MPQVVKANPSKKAEELKKLKDVGAGNIFRFASVTFEEALTEAEGAHFYMVVKTTPEKAGRVSIVSIDGALLQERDDDHMVIVHPAKIEIGEAKRV